MQSLNTVFTSTINKHRNSKDLSNIISELCFELSRKKVQRLKDEKHIQRRLSELLELYAKGLDKEELKNSQNLGAIIEGIIKAASYNKEEFLYKTIYEKEQLEASINAQRNSIKETIQDTFATLEKHIKSIDKSLREDALRALNDTQLKDVKMLGILKETTTEALITTIEKSSDIEDTAFEITKNITFQAINEGNFTKDRFTNISSTILESAIEIADEDQAFAKDLLKGVIYGLNEGMTKAINKFKNDLKFALILKK